MNSHGSHSLAVVRSAISLVFVGWCVSQSNDNEDGPESWRNNFEEFQKQITAVAAGGAIPSFESLVAEDDVFPMSDGAGGLIDPSPEAGTVQFLLNRQFNRQKIRWKIKIVLDPMTSIWNDALILFPLPSMDIDLASTSDDEAVPMSIIGFYVHGIENAESLEFQRGDVLLIEATIGRGELTELMHFSGVVAVQHVADQPAPFFIVGLEDAKITRLQRGLEEDRLQTGSLR